MGTVHNKGRLSVTVDCVDCDVSDDQSSSLFIFVRPNFHFVIHIVPNIDTETDSNTSYFWSIIIELYPLLYKSEGLQEL